MAKPAEANVIPREMLKYEGEEVVNRIYVTYMKCKLAYISCTLARVADDWKRVKAIPTV